LNDILYVSPRMSGVFSTSNAMGGFSTVFLLLIGYLWINELDNRKLLSVTAALAIFCLVKSDSKTAMASLVIAGYFLLPSSKLKTISTVISITLFLLVAVFALFETEMFLTAVSRHGDPNEILTFTGRTFIWPAVIEKILDQPLFGYGLG
ncbi:O-antigen ligase family protein, partial [Vibrio sinaloensis]|uniref:O-antigen ligase family protein n=1 Tax=Photobacterium sp. (strain ATCC 43367) TaxID=379097 RepID=UPI002F40B99B